MYLFMNNSNLSEFVSSIFFKVLLMGEGIFCRLDLSSNRLAINKSYYRVYSNTRIIRMFIERI